MSNVFSFLLPSSGLDWVFFGLLLFWAAVSLYAAKQSKNTMDIRINSSRFKNIKATVDELSAASRHPVWDHLIDNAPGFALVLGLLGTFLGIGLAIQGAGLILADMNTNANSATDMRQTIGNLSPMLSEIGLKFKSSAWGILIHIFLRISIPAFGIEEKRLHEVFKELEHDHLEDERIKNERWKQIENMIETQAEFAKKMEKMLTEALFIKTAQEGSVAKVLESQGVHLEVIADVQKSFGQNVKTLGKSVQEFEKTVDAFRGTMKQSLEEMQKSVKETSQGLEDAVDSMKSEVRSTFSSFRDNVSTTLNKVGDDIASSSQAIKSSVDVLSHSMASELQNVTRVTADLTSHSREMTMAIQEQKHMLEEMGDKVQEIAARGAEYGFALEDVTNNVSKLAGSDGVMVKKLDLIASNAIETKDNTKAATAYLEKLANSTNLSRKKDLSLFSRSRNGEINE